VVFHDKALDELGRVAPEAKRLLRERARALALRPYSPEAGPMGPPFEGFFVVPVPEADRGIIYRVEDSVLVVEAILPLAALDLRRPAAGSESPEPTPPPLPASGGPESATPDAQGFIPPP